ncbi:hypothetical protein EDB84DRAFT_1435014 [Lactarius hengduanensis]|nr:hypothetical protein EDB84DRAFT_1435014 [Lactarius hengduanensis]
MWSWSVVGGACDSGLPAAAAAIIVIMLGVVGSLEELNSGESLGHGFPQSSFTPAVIVKAIVLGLRKCTTDLCERHATREAGENTSYMKKSRMSVCSVMREETPPKRLKGVELEWGRAACIVRTQERPTDGQLGKAVVCKYEAPKLHHACDEAIRVEVGAVWELEALGSGYRQDGLEHLNVELIWVNRGKW